MPRPRTPSRLKRAGKALWKAILDDLAPGWELDARELHLLERAALLADRAAELERAVAREGITTTGSRGQTVIHPALVELRQLELVRLRLLGALELVDPKAARAQTPAQARALRAAESRWRDHRERRAGRG